MFVHYDSHVAFSDIDGLKALLVRAFKILIGLIA